MESPHRGCHPVSRLRSAYGVLLFSGRGEVFRSKKRGLHFLATPIQRTLDASMESPLLVRTRGLLSDSNSVDRVNVIIAVIDATCMSMTRHVQTELNDVVDGAPRDGSITSSMQCVLTST